MCDRFCLCLDLFTQNSCGPVLVPLVLVVSICTHIFFLHLNELFNSFVHLIKLSELNLLNRIAGGVGLGVTKTNQNTIGRKHYTGKHTQVNISDETRPIQEF